MIDPTKITNFHRSSSELEELLLFCIAVAGKNAVRTSKMLDELLGYGRYYCNGTPFEIIKKLNEVKSFPNLLRCFGFGCYTHKARGFVEASHSGLDLKTCSVNDLEKIHGVGMKTSRFFLLHSRYEAGVACLDTHVLAFLRDLGHSAPKTTPNKKRYLHLEQEFLKLVKETGKSVAEFDLNIWNVYSGNEKNPDEIAFLENFKEKALQTN